MTSGFGRLLSRARRGNGSLSRVALYEFYLPNRMCRYQAVPYMSHIFEEDVAAAALEPRNGVAKLHYPVKTIGFLSFALFLSPSLSLHLLLLLLL